MTNQAIREQRKNFNAHRPFYRMRFRAADMDFAFQWVLGSSAHGGANVGESFYAASQMHDGDPVTWEREWFLLAQRVHHRAEEALAKGHTVSASDAFLRAAVYYRAVLASMRPTDPGFKPCVSAVRACFQSGSYLLTPPVERLEIPFEGKSLPGYFQKAAEDDRPRKTLLMIGGGETFTEDLYFYIAPAAVRRGYNFATFDMPGQGALPFEGLFFRPDFETPMKAVLDALFSRKEVDPERLAAYGISAGGYIVPRAASREPRIRACIVNSIIPDLYALLAGTSIPKLKGITRRLAQWKAPFLMRMLELIAWRWGVDARDVALLVEKNRDLHYNPQDISCPTLILIGEGENANPRVNQVQRESLRSLPDKRSRLLIGPLEEGAAGHCMGENLPLMSAMVFDWLDDVFA